MEQGFKKVVGFLSARPLLVWGLLALMLSFGVDLLWADAGAAAAEAAAHGGEHAEAGHGGAIIGVLLSLMIILFAAKCGGDLAMRLGQPEVLGELVVGMILGNLTLVGINHFEYLESDKIIEVLSELGVILLLFQVGLETNIGEMKEVGLSSLLVAIVGVIAPFFLGWGVAHLFVPEADLLVHLFVGATLCATSVGITARVLRDIGKIRTGEAKIILGAAVIDDVLGLLVLAVVSGVITAANQGTEMEMASVAGIVALAVGFLLGAVLLGNYLAPLCFKLATSLRSHGLLLATSLLICFGLSALAGKVGLAPIVGAFTAGLILDPLQYKDLSSRNHDAKIEDLIEPIAELLVPIFFVLMGARVDLLVFTDSSVLGFAFWLTLAAIVGKQVCSFGVLQKDLDKTVVGFGMIPRGEVGLIFASIGAALLLKGEPVVDKATFGAVVIMVVVTTMVTPPILKWRFLTHGQKITAEET